MNLTPAQTRLIQEARGRERYQISFFGIPEKTKQKFIELGLVVAVPTLSEDAKEALRLETVQLCADLQGIILNASSTHYQTYSVANKIQANIRHIHATINVLTEAGQTIELT